MKKRIIIITIAILLAVTAVITGIYIAGRDKVSPGSVLLKSGNGKQIVKVSDLDLSPVKGSITNKKGETRNIDTDGYRLADIPDLAGIKDFSEINVYADDEYSATLSKKELSDTDRAWLIIDVEGIRLIVFGDKDSKRDVKNVVRIEIR